MMKYILSLFLALGYSSLAATTVTNKVSQYPNTNGVGGTDLILLAVTNRAVPTNFNIKYVDFSNAIVGNLPYQPTNNVLTQLAGNSGNTVTNVSPGANISASISAGTLSVATTGLGTAANSNAVAFVASSSGLGTNNLFYSPTNTPQASNQVAETVNGIFGQATNLVEWKTNGIVLAAVKSNGCLILPSGTASLPSIGFLSDDDNSGTGIYRSGANLLSITLNGSEAARFSSDHLDLEFNAAYMRFGAGGQFVPTFGQEINTGFFSYMSGATSSSNRFYHVFASSTVGEFLETGYDTAFGWFFLRCITNNSGPVAPIHGLNIGVSTNQQLYLTISNTVQIGLGRASSGLATLGGTYSAQTSPISNTGTAQTNLMTLSIPINTLTNNGDRLTFSVSGKFVANADAKELLVIYGSETVFDSTSQVVNGGAWTITGEIIRTGNTAQTAWASYNGAGLSLFTDAAAVSLSQTNGIATLLAIAGTAAASNDITNRTMTVQYWPSP